ncbi:MAG: methyltransferase domain-containing protein [Chloroflexi bacterium]|nr:methyltransferase domain-containing protein [Chloroflexota bacterium]MCI0579652.1 methyltransferase domain-containing protein [Chloroflexota bacterium]MCI0645908.1 methyltransferase domain-containing protein [Chloroflexota bacterium]MCI0725763.1 methyltransferase domain-containing protein [Chloroflexota bacterium]
MKWTTKALIQRTLAQLPAGQQVYYLGQRLGGGLRGFTVDGKVRQGLALMGAFQEAGETIAGRATVELGTGWAPVVPLLFWLYGQERCETFDVSRLLRHSLVVKSARQLAAMTGDSNSLLAQWPGGAVQPERQRVLSDLVARKASGPEILQTCQVKYHAPGDTAATGLPAASTDVVYSNTVLEHVPLRELQRLFDEAGRILRPGGYMLHQIDPSDHFSHGDPSIPVLNFLQFSQNEFECYNSTLFYQNRLRAPFYYQLVQEHGFEIVYWTTDLNQKALAQLTSLAIDRAFAHFSPEELSGTGIRLVARVSS